MIGEADIIVIGGGPAGAAITGRLAERGLKVVLIEAGKSDRHYRSRIPALTSAVVQNPQFDWCYQVEPDPTLNGRADVWPAGRLLGGGSALNGMMFIRGHQWDYDHWADEGAEGWDYKSVLPYFRRMEDNERGSDAWRGTGGPIAVSEGRARYPITHEWIAAAQSFGIPRSPDLNGELAEGVDFVQVSQRNGTRCSSARGYLHDTQGPNRPEIVLDAQVLKIDVQDGRARGVVYLQDGTEKTIQARHGVVLSAGAMNTPRLLMLSGIGPAGHLGEMGIPLMCDRPGVGKNLQDHVGTHVVNDVDAVTLNNDARGLRGAWQVLKFALARRGALTTAIGHAHAYVRSRPDLPAPNLQLAFAAFAFDFDDKGRLMLRKEPTVSTLIGLMRPRNRGHIRLRSADPLAPPVISHQQLSDEDDVDQIIEGIGIARGILQQPPIARFVKGELRPGEALSTPEQLREYVHLASIPLYHPVGTAKIGRRDDPMAVVDSDQNTTRVSRFRLQRAKDQQRHDHGASPVRHLVQVDRKPLRREHQFWRNQWHRIPRPRAEQGKLDARENIAGLCPACPEDRRTSPRHMGRLGIVPDHLQRVIGLDRGADVERAGMIKRPAIMFGRLPAAQVPADFLFQYEIVGFAQEMAQQNIFGRNRSIGFQFEHPMSVILLPVEQSMRRTANMGFHTIVEGRGRRDISRMGRHG